MQRTYSAAARRRRIVVSVSLAVLALFSRGTPGRVAHAASNSRAVVIVDTGHSVHIEVISFSSATISGLEALRLAGASPETVGYSGQGIAVCKLYGVGHEATRDECLGTPSDPRYWAYFRAPPGARSFTYSQVGAGSSVVGDGYVEGWRFGTGAPPPFHSFCEIAGCSEGAGSTADSDSASVPAGMGASQQAGGSGGAPADSSGAGDQGPSGTGSEAGSDAGFADATAMENGSLTPGIYPALTEGAVPGGAMAVAEQSSEEEPTGDRMGLGAVGSAVALVIAIAAIAAAGVIARRRRLPPD